MKKWKIEELVYFSRKPVEITLEELGWFLVSDDTSGKRLWWREGYLFYFFLDNNMITDIGRRILTDFIDFGHIDYVKIGYHKFMVVNLDNYSTEIADHCKTASTEIVAFPILKSKNEFVDMIMDRIHQEEGLDAEQGKQSA